MKKTLGIISVGILTVATVFFITNTNDLQNEAKPSEIATNLSEPTKGTMMAEIQTFKFADAVDKSELIAELTIGNKIKEIDEPSPKTLYEATVTRVLKRTENLENIVIMQQGNSEWSFNDNDQFTPNEEYILFLVKAIGEGYDGSNIYWILGEETNIYSINDGDKVVKNAMYDEGLKTIEVEVPVNTLNVLIRDGREKEIQVLNKEQFESRIIELVSNKSSN